MKRRLEAKGVRRERLHTIPVWSKKDEVEPLPREENPLLDEWGLRDRCIVMYSGNAGLAHRFDEVLGAMRALKDHPELFFLFMTYAVTLTVTDSDLVERSVSAT